MYSLQVPFIFAVKEKWLPTHCGPSLILQGLSLIPTFSWTAASPIGPPAYQSVLNTTPSSSEPTLQDRVPHAGQLRFAKAQESLI